MMDGNPRMYVILRYANVSVYLFLAYYSFVSENTCKSNLAVMYNLTKTVEKS